MLLLQCVIVVIVTVQNNSHLHIFHAAGAVSKAPDTAVHSTLWRVWKRDPHLPTLETQTSWTGEQHGPCLILHGHTSKAAAGVLRAKSALLHFKMTDKVLTEAATKIVAGTERAWPA